MSTEPAIPKSVPSHCSQDALVPFALRDGDCSPDAALSAWRQLAQSGLPSSEHNDAWRSLTDFFGGQASFFRKVFQTHLSVEELAILCRAVNLHLPTPRRKIKTVALHYAHFGIGGLERVMLRFMELFHGMGIRVLFLTDRPPAPEREYPLPDYVRRIVIPPIQNGLETPHANASFRTRMDALSRVITEEQIDLFYSHHFYSRPLLFDILLFKAVFQIPCFLHYHSVCSIMAASGDLFFSEMVDYFRFCDRLIVLSRVDQLFFEAQGIPATYLLNPPAFQKQIRSEEFHSESKTILFNGRLSFEKQPLDAIRIFSEVVKRVPDAKLCILGDGEDIALKQEMRDRIKDLNLKGAVELCGYSKDVRPYYENAALLLSTSMFEGYPMTFCEAKSFGVPIVCYDMPYLEMLRNPEEGICSVPLGDIGAAAQEIIRLLQDIPYRKMRSDQSLQSFDIYGNPDLQTRFSQLFSQLESGEKIPLSTYPRELSILLHTICTHFSFGHVRIRERSESAVIHTMSYRIGHAVTWLPRMLRKTFRMLHAEGGWNTLQRIIRKIRRSRKSYSPE